MISFCRLRQKVQFDIWTSGYEVGHQVSQQIHFAEQSRGQSPETDTNTLNKACAIPIPIPIPNKYDMFLWNDTNTSDNHMSIPIPIPIPLRLFLQYRDQYQYLLNTSFNTNTDTIPKVSKIFDFNTDFAPIPISIAQHWLRLLNRMYCSLLRYTSQ